MSHEWESVVIPDAITSSSVAFHRSLAEAGVHTIGVSPSANAASFASKYCDETVVVPDPEENLAGYEESLLSLARRPDVRTIVPLNPEDIYVLSKRRADFANHIATPWPTFETLRTAHDRNRLFERAREVGVPIPRTRPFDEVDDWSRDVVIKPRYGILAGGYVDDHSLTGVADPPSARFVEADDNVAAGDIRSTFDHTPIVQNYVPGTEYSVGVLYEDGEAVVTSQKRILRGVTYYCGPSVYHESVEIPELESVCRDLLDHLDWHGPADVDIIRDGETGKFKLLEINPRFWATVALEIHAGIDFPARYWALATDQSPTSASSYQPGIRSHNLSGELSYLRSVIREDHSVCDRPPLPSTLYDITRSLLNDRRLDLFSLDDPRPFVTKMREHIPTG